LQRLHQLLHKQQLQLLQLMQYQRLQKPLNLHLHLPLLLLLQSKHSQLRYKQWHQPTLLLRLKLLNLHL
jgi:hypothetical protein